MKRDTAMQNYYNAEKLELILEKNNIPIVSALIFNNRKMQEIDGQFFYIFNWFDGRALKNNEIKEIHCLKIGNVLASIHSIDRREEVYNHDEIDICWDFYIDKLADENKLEFWKRVIQWLK